MSALLKTPGRQTWWRVIAPLLAMVVTCAVVGCRSVDRAQVGAWREALMAADEQSSVTFQATNELVRDSRREWIARQPELLESDLRPGSDSASVARWQAALRALVAYASAVEVLLAPEASAGVGASVKGLSERIGVAANTTTLKADGALARAVGRLGERVAQAAANGEARRLMLEADADVRGVLNQMSDMLLLEQDDLRAGVVPTIEATWNTRLAQLEEQFRTASEGQRGAIIDRYADAMARRDRATGAVLALRAGLLNLATAHSAAANGHVGDIKSVIEQMRRDIAEGRALIDALRAERAKKNAGGVQ